MNTRLSLAWIALAAASRLLPHPPNVTPLAAMALLGGVRLPKAQAYALPLLALLLSDAALGFHATIPFVYAAFLLTVMLARAQGRTPTPASLAGASVASSLLFFLISNFGVWLTQDLYTKDPSGLAACYTAAIPFLRNSMLGDFAFTGLVFSLDALSQWRPRGSAVASV